MTLTIVVITLIMVMDPFGNLPVFLSLLRNLSPKRRRIVIIRELLIALFILAVFLYFGQNVLNSLNIGQPALQIAGGVILFLIALRMIFPAEINLPDVQFDRQALKTEPLIVPLAMPMVAGPSAMAYVILISTQYPADRFLWLLGLIIAWSFTALVLLLGDWLSRFLGDKLLVAIERLMGMILTTLAIQMLLAGIKSFMTHG